MNRLKVLVAALLVSGFAFAQEPEEALIETVPVDEPMPAEEPVAEMGEAEASAPEKDPIKVYTGLDLASTTLSVAGRDLDSNLIRLRGGWWMAEGLAVEAQFGAGLGGDAADEAKTAGYFGLYLVPTAKASETVELAFPVGYSRIGYDTALGGINGNGFAYGFNLNVGLSELAAEAEGLSVGAGFMVYSQDSTARSYGFNVGIRYDFDADIVRPTQLFDGLF